MQEQLPRVAMIGLEKSVRDPENTTLKAPASKNLCHARVNLSHAFIKLLYPVMRDNCL
jgi:hypothetical protein